MGVAVMVILNACMLGWEAEYQVDHHIENPKLLPVLFRRLEVFFALFFSCEIALRLAVFRLRFFYFKGLAMWNIFDFFIVVLQAADLLVTYVMAEHQMLNMSVLRLMRIIRVL